MYCPKLSNIERQFPKLQVVRFDSYRTRAINKMYEPHRDGVLLILGRDVGIGVCWKKWWFCYPLDNRRTVETRLSCQALLLFLYNSYVTEYIRFE